MQRIVSAPERLATGFQFLEGPVWLEGGSSLGGVSVSSRGALLFSDIPAARLYIWHGGEAGVFRNASGKANGNALTGDGRLLTCEHENRRVSRTELDGSVTALATHFDGKRLNSPNDVVAKSDGSCYFTDPPYGVEEDARELDFQGVYRVAAEDDSVSLVANDFEKPNGLAFSPDESLLYVADTERCQVRRFEVGADGTLGGGEVLCDCERPDGIRVDPGGNLWIAAMEGVEVHDTSGQLLERATLPERPANLAFGGTDRSELYVCARTSLYRLRIAVSE